MFRKNIPNIITLMNLSFGVLAIMIASSTDKIHLHQRGEDINLIYFSCLFAIAAALFDRFDGQLARKLNATSEIGKQLDSLCDLISFGVAPAVIAWKLHFASIVLIMPGGRLIGYFLALLFPISGAIRLARFNIQDDSHIYFGIPITLAGSSLALLNLLTTYLFLRGRFTRANVSACIVLMPLLSVLMISRFQVAKV